MRWWINLSSIKMYQQGTKVSLNLYEKKTVNYSKWVNHFDGYFYIDFFRQGSLIVFRSFRKSRDFDRNKTKDFSWYTQNIKQECLEC